MKNQDFLDKLDAFVQELQEARSRAGDAAAATAQKLAEAARKTITADPNVQNDIGK